MLKKMLLCSGTLLFAICFSAPSLWASCPNVPAVCDYGAIGWQGTCLHFPKVCKDCGPKHCPDLPASYTDLPDQINSSCLEKIISSGRVDGCSIPKEVDPMFGKVFKAACDEHDICYHTDTAKSHCDNDLRNNIVYTCDQYYKGIANEGQKKACETAASLFYLGVVTGGQGGYDKDQDWKNKNCPQQ